jgi:hypothetical protein
MCIHGCINEKSENETKKGSIKIIQHNEAEIHIYTGYKLLNLILEENTDTIIDYIRQLLDKYIIIE